MMRSCVRNKKLTSDSRVNDPSKSVIVNPVPAESGSLTLVLRKQAAALLLKIMQSVNPRTLSSAIISNLYSGILVIITPDTSSPSRRLSLDM